MKIYNHKRIGECEVQVDNVRFLNRAMIIEWSSPEIGFGECAILPGDGPLVTVDDEYMGRDFVNTLLQDIIDNQSCFYSDK